MILITFVGIYAEISPACVSIIGKAVKDPFPNFSESLVFIDSQYSSGVQLADFCAGAIFKKFEDNVAEFYETLVPEIRCHNKKIWGCGIKVF